MGKEFKYEITDELGTLSEGSKGWAKSVNRISWNDGPSNIDIRNMNMENDKMGKGISLTDEETEELLNILLDEGFGTVDKLQEALDRKNCYVVKSGGFEDCFTKVERDEEDEERHITNIIIY